MEKEIFYIEESQTWICPKAGRYKVICVGGGASGGFYYNYNNVTEKTIPVPGKTTSFGDVISADGGMSAWDYATGVASVSGYGGYDGFNYGGCGVLGADKTATCNGNATIPAYTGGTATSAIGWGAGGGAAPTSASGNAGSGCIAGRAGKIKTTIVLIDENENIPCTIGAGGIASESAHANVASGADGVIIIQYLGA